MASIKIPKRPNKSIDGLKKEQMDCLTWYVLFGDPIEECFARFVAPQFKDNPRLLKEYAKQFMAGASARDYIVAYKAEIDSLSRVSESSVPVSRSDNESDEDFNARRKRNSVEKVIAKISEMVDDISDAETLLDTIKAMKDTGYFDSATQVSPPRRYLAESCNTCEYKRFIDAHVKSGDIDKVDE